MSLPYRTKVTRIGRTGSIRMTEAVIVTTIIGTFVQRRINILLHDLIALIILSKNGLSHRAVLLSQMATELMDQ